MSCIIFTVLAEICSEVEHHETTGCGFNLERIVSGKRLPAPLQELFKIRNIGTKRVHNLCMIEVLEVVHKRRPDSLHGLVKVSQRSGGKLWVVDICSVLGMAHIIPYGTRN